MKLDVLVVEDDLTVIFVLETALKACGLNYKIAKSVNEAVTIINEYEVGFIILDINLGHHECGLDIIEKSSPSKCRFIVHSTDNDKVIRERAISLGALGFWKKPSSFDYLITNINTLHNSTERI